MFELYLLSLRVCSMSVRDMVINETLEADWESESLHCHLLCDLG